MVGRGCLAWSATESDNRMMKKRVVERLGLSPCSRSARPQKALAGRAQSGQTYPFHFK